MAWWTSGTATNVFGECLWRSVKQEEVYLHDYRDVSEAIDGCPPIFGGTTRNPSISPSTTTPPSQFTPAGSPWWRRLRENSGTSTPKPKTSGDHSRDLSQGKKVLFMISFPRRTNHRPSPYSGRFTVLTMGSTSIM